MRDILARIGSFLSNVRQNDFNNVYRAKTPRRKEKLTADLRRFSQIRIGTFHRRDAGREKKSKFAGFVLPIGRVIFSIADDQPLSAVVPTWAHRGG